MIRSLILAGCIAATGIVPPAFSKDPQSLDFVALAAVAGDVCRRFLETGKVPETTLAQNGFALIGPATQTYRFVNPVPKTRNEAPRRVSVQFGASEDAADAGCIARWTGVPLATGDQLRRFNDSDKKIPEAAQAQFLDRGYKRVPPPRRTDFAKYFAKGPLKVRTLASMRVVNGLRMMEATYQLVD